MVLGMLFENFKNYYILRYVIYEFLKKVLGVPQPTCLVRVHCSLYGHYTTLHYTILYYICSPLPNSSILSLHLLKLQKTFLHLTHISLSSKPHATQSIRSTIKEKRNIDGIDTKPFGWVA